MCLPNNSKIILSLNRDKDSRGDILSIVDQISSNVSIIKCNKGSIRSNHYHLTDWHFMYVLEGSIDYFYKNVDSEVVKYINVQKDENIFTPCMEIHGTYFPEDTRLIVTSKNPRDQDTYEKDTVRVNFINDANIMELLSKYKK
ncbi:hypothetical protein N9C93_00355 [Pelagibacterales bacterium]|nr:hypothetical protein [Pelagibacterales bacterium]